VDYLEIPTITLLVAVFLAIIQVTKVEVDFLETTKTIQVIKEDCSATTIITSAATIIITITLEEAYLVLVVTTNNLVEDCLGIIQAVDKYLAIIIIQEICRILELFL
jgi:hypothetical protein